MDIDAIYSREIDKLEPHELLIITWPDDRLKTKCQDITRFDDENNKYLEQLVLDMAHTMIRCQGIGLAAPQVAVMANVIVLLVENKPIVLVNPEITWQSKDDLFQWEEGCLSVPGYFEKRHRPNRCIVKFKDIFGKDHESEFVGLWAFAVQHEIDHLQGKCFVDNLSQLKKQFSVKPKIKKELSKRKAHVQL